MPVWVQNKFSLRKVVLVHCQNVRSWGRSQKKCREQALYIAVISSKADFNQVKYGGAIFVRKIKWRYRIEMIEAKAFRTFIRVYSLFKSDQLSANINLQEPCVLYIGRAYRYLPDVASYIFFQQILSTEYFKHAAISLFFSSKCRLFHNANFFWFLSYSHFTYRCAKI
jgi:hypothetical protein